MNVIRINYDYLAEYVEKGVVTAASLHPSLGANIPALGLFARNPQLIASGCEAHHVQDTRPRVINFNYFDDKYPSSLIVIGLKLLLNERAFMNGVHVMNGRIVSHSDSLSHSLTRR